MEGRDTENNKRDSKQLQIAEEAMSIAEKDSEERKNEMEVEIDKVVKAKKEAQSAAESGDREEQLAHNKESMTTSSTRRTRGNTSRKWKLNSRRSVMTSSLSWTRASSHQPDGLQEPKDVNKGRPRGHQVLNKSILHRSQRSDRLAM